MTPAPAPADGTATAAHPAADGTAPRGLPVVLTALRRPAGTPVVPRMPATADDRG